MLQIKDPLIKRLLLEQIVEEIDGGGIDGLLRAGFSAEFLDSMRHRSARDLIRIAALPINLHVRFEEDSVASFLSRLDSSRKSAKMCEYFIRHGASVRMMCDLFRLSAEDVRALRAQLLDAEDATRGRMPPARERDRIHESWHALKTAHPKASFRDQVYRLHQQFHGLQIDALCRTLNEFDENDRSRARARRALH